MNVIIKLTPFEDYCEDNIVICRDLWGKGQKCLQNISFLVIQTHPFPFEGGSLGLPCDLAPGAAEVVLWLFWVKFLRNPATVLW